MRILDYESFFGLSLFHPVFIVRLVLKCPIVHEHIIYVNPITYPQLIMLMRSKTRI